MIDLEIKVNYKHVVAHLTDLERNQVPFALARSINATMATPKGGAQASGLVNVQGEERLQLRRAFELRRTEWADRSIKVTHFATKREPWGTIGVHPPGAQGDERADVLAKFETDTVKRPKSGRTIAVPIDPSVKRKGTGIIPRRNRPSGLNLHDVGGRVVGDRDTFVVRKPDGSGWILRRTKRGVIALYRLVHQVEIEPDLNFVNTAVRTVDRVWDRNMLRELEHALRTAK